VAPYPGVNNALATLQQAGKKVIFISNAPRRVIKAIEGLRMVGVVDNLYDSAITSGEVVFEYLNFTVPRPLSPVEVVEFSPGRKKYIIIGPERDAGLMEGSDYIRVTDVVNADFMIVTGFDHDNSTIAEKQPYLDKAIKLNLPLLSANPDLVVVRQTGERALCAGVIANKYEQMGGKVMQFGKPYKTIYNRALELAGNHDKSRIAAIGDSLSTDILGANNFGIDSYFIAGGIFDKELGINHGQLPPAEKLYKLCSDYKIFPTGVLPEFAFSKENK
jgi:HAD superfamily hydrolase (TIGR01459 family)